MEQEIEKPISKFWVSRVQCLTAVSQYALVKQINECYVGKFSVGTQIFLDGQDWVAFVYYKVKAYDVWSLNNLCFYLYIV